MMHFLGEHIQIYGSPKSHILFIRCTIQVIMHFIREPHIVQCDFVMLCPCSQLCSVLSQTVNSCTMDTGVNCRSEFIAHIWISPSFLGGFSWVSLYCCTHRFDVLCVTHMHSMSVVRFQHCAIMFKLVEKRPTTYQNKHKTISAFPQHFFVSTKQHCL
jgi:hypothetical protein